MRSSFAIGSFSFSSAGINLTEASSDAIRLSLLPNHCLNNSLVEAEKLPFPLLENMPYQTWDEFKEFYDDTVANVSNHLGFCFDIPHSWITNHNRFLDLPEFCSELLTQTSGYIHISGGTKDEDTHFPSLTEGDLPIDKVKTFLKDIQFKGTVTMELAPRSLDEIDKIIHSYMIMLGFAGKRIHRTKIRIKRPFIMRKVRRLASKVDSSTFKKK